jgi:3-oxoacyl-[acyl-carrier-protein] synthase-3
VYSFLRKRAGWPPPPYGNTTSGTLPIAFHEARQLGKAPEGALVAFTALGAGLHWGSVLMRV